MQNCLFIRNKIPWWSRRFWRILIFNWICRLSTWIQIYVFNRNFICRFTKLTLRIIIQCSLFPYLLIIILFWSCLKWRQNISRGWWVIFLIIILWSISCHFWRTYEIYICLFFWNLMPILIFSGCNSVSISAESGSFAARIYVIEISTLKTIIWRIMVGQTQLAFGISSLIWLPISCCLRIQHDCFFLISKKHFFNFILIN